MTGIADFYLYMKRPYSRDRRRRFLAHFRTNKNGDQDEPTRFVLLSWKRTGSNLLCGILHLHPEIIMHNELFNPIDIFTYHPAVFRGTDDKQSDAPPSTPRWTVLTRDLFPEDFLDYIWTGSHLDSGSINLTTAAAKVKPRGKVVGFKSFPEHWTDVRNDAIFQRALLEDLRVKKIVLHRQDELAVYVSTLRADQTGAYLTHAYPKDLKLRIEPAKFQAFLDHYRSTFQHKYKSPMAGRDSFLITYEEMVDQEHFTEEILPKLYHFLGVDPSFPYQTLKETVRQADPNEDLATVIENYEELEFCFRHTSVLHFAKRKELGIAPPCRSPSLQEKSSEHFWSASPYVSDKLSTWSLLLPICSRGKSLQSLSKHSVNNSRGSQQEFNANRFLQLSMASQHDSSTKMEDALCWDMLQNFAETLRATSSKAQLTCTEAIVGIDVDDPLYANESARKRIQAMMPCGVKFVYIQPQLYGKLCRIWNFLAKHAMHDYVVLLGDDIRLLDEGWQAKIAETFHRIARRTGLPLGAACVAMHDLSFPGFPTFPVMHRWHMESFGTLLPKQFVNQGGDPYLYELYSRFNASEFVQSCRLENTIGGDSDARYRKYHINWRGQILNMGLRHLRTVLEEPNPNGVVLDVVVPSYRTNNEDFLERIVRLRSSVQAYVKFWIVVDNPLDSHLNGVQALAQRLNQEQLQQSSNYFINVIHYSDNRGASYARNTGYNYSTADWILFLDDDIVPDENLLDAYIGALRRYPDGKVFVGCTDLPKAHNLWTQMLRTCNVGYFYSIAEKMVHPPWGVTANLLVRGSRYNPTIQFKDIYPKTGGGEDIDLVYQFKSYYPMSGLRTTIAVPEAKVQHPWWNHGNTCYRQITGWAQGDCLCITEWPEKTFLTFPNWVEHTLFLVLPAAIYTKRPVAGLAVAAGVITVEHVLKGLRYLGEACRICGNDSSWWQRLMVAVGAGTVLSSQEVTRAVCLIRRCSPYSLFRRVDWFDGQQPTIKLDIQLHSMVGFALNLGICGLGYYYLG